MNPTLDTVRNDHSELRLLLKPLCYLSALTAQSWGGEHPSFLWILVCDRNTHSLYLHKAQKVIYIKSSLICDIAHEWVIANSITKPLLRGCTERELDEDKWPPALCWRATIGQERTAALVSVENSRTDAHRYKWDSWIKAGVSCAHVLCPLCPLPPCLWLVKGPQPHKV